MFVKLQMLISMFNWVIEKYNRGSKNPKTVVLSYGVTWNGAYYYRLLLD